MPGSGKFFKTGRVWRKIKAALTRLPHGRGMVSRRRLRTVLTALCLYMVAAALIGYFGINAFTGNRGLTAKQDIDRQLAELTAEIGRLKAERNVWARRVSLLRSDRIDPDMLDERARVLLNYAHPNDVILFVKQP